MEGITLLWKYFLLTQQGSQILWLTMTLLIFQAGAWIYTKLGKRPIFNPVLLAVIILVIILKLTDTEYKAYFKGAEFIHFLLGPATVALAIPLYKQMSLIKKSFLPVTSSLIIGSITGVLSAVAIGRIFGSDKTVILSLAPKSITTPIAMGVSEKIGGLPSLTAVVVVLTGITGSILGDLVLDRLGVKDDMARGLAYGVASHGIGTAHALQASQVAGAFAGLAMGLNGLFTAITLPYIISFIS